MKPKKYLYIDPFGILRFELGGKIFLLFITEFLAIWVSFMILSSWEVFELTDHGKAILGLNIFFLGSILNSIVFKNNFITIYKSEIIKQISNLCFFVLIFIMLNKYKLEDFKNNGNNIEYYYNPLGMSYIFILVFLTFFYIIYNSHK